ncbi:MAG TPA: LPXTG cell wall anchor domain-containing protein [Acidimicrobiia bacterium]|nr:LPXTG cell wall anchor domain-containing protein [Acidimicrobiia bacterium]
MDEFPARFADFLESIALKIRAMTVDRVARVVKLSAMGMVAATLGIMAVVFLLLTIYGALAIPLGPDGAFAVLGLVFLIGGMLVWRRRRSRAS